MKTAISIPDKLFRQADKLAKKLGVSRSQLYAQAVEKLVKEKTSSEITKKLNEVYPGGKGSELDRDLAAYQARQWKEWSEGETW